jgi:hypothetical protein
MSHTSLDLYTQDERKEEGTEIGRAIDYEGDNN